MRVQDQDKETKVRYLLHDIIMEGKSTKIEKPISITHKQIHISVVQI